MADLSQKTVLGITVQASAGTYNAPGVSDCYPIANLRPTINGVKVTNPEYSGTVHKPGDAIVGKKVSLSFQMVVRGPGGATPPAAGDWIPGRLLRAVGFTEVVTAAAIPAAAEALAAADTDNVTLGDGAAATADLYRGLALNLVANGVAPKSLTSIVAYGADKVAQLPEVFGAAPVGNYQIPKQLSYLLSAAESTVLLSSSFWLGRVRYNLVDVAVSAFKATFTASTQDSASYCLYDVTLEGKIESTADENATVLQPAGPAPFFKDGDFWVDKLALGGSSFSIDMGVKLGYPPNPNEADGNDAGQIVETTRTVSLTLNQQLKATKDFIALADAQGYHSIWAQFGQASGNIVSVLIPEARFDYQSPDPSGDFVTQQGDMLIDAADKAICITFPYL